MATMVSELLETRVLTESIREVRSPASFLDRLLFANRQPQPDDKIEISTLHGDRQMAPFVEVNGEAINVDGYNEDFQVVSAPNIRIKRPMVATDAMLRRLGGFNVFTDRGQKEAQIREAIARDQQRMNDLLENNMEWLASQTLTGVVSYSVARQANFRLDFGRLATHNINAAVSWATFATSQPADDLLAAARLINDDSELNATHAILSTEAATNLFKSASIQNVLDNRRMEAGSLEFRLFEATGARFLGTISSIQLWEYGRSITVNGVSTPLIRAGYAEVVHVGPSNQFVSYFGAIPDWDAIEEGLWMGEKFSKSWLTKDPSVRWMLLTSRPLPVPRRVNATVSLDTSP